MIFSVLGFILGPGTAAKVVGSKGFAPIMRGLGIVLILAVAWFAFDRWRDGIYHAGELAERAKWQALDLENQVAQARQLADQAAGALEESRRNVATAAELRDEFRSMEARVARRSAVLERFREVPLDALFEPGPDPCRVYVRPALVSVHNASGIDAAPVAPAPEADPGGMPTPGFDWPAGPRPEGLTAVRRAERTQ